MEFRSALASVVSTSMVVGCVFGLAFAAGSGRGAVGWAGCYKARTSSPMRWNGCDHVANQSYEQ